MPPDSLHPEDSAYAEPHELLHNDHDWTYGPDGETSNLFTTDNFNLDGSSYHAGAMFETQLLDGSDLCFMYSTYDASNTAPAMP